MRIQHLNLRKKRRAARVRARIVIVSERPRLSVFRSNSHLYAQLIDDKQGKTLVSASTLELAKEKKNKTAKAALLGDLLASKAKKAGITKVVFDRGFYKYHGRVKALAESLRNSGITI
ncbi:MAG: 50S ribosomal protein L18 [Patescibacteria group bacterium]|nr:50S ribosomal protein L18 [Patescibacteria group bacterium]